MGELILDKQIIRLLDSIIDTRFEWWTLHIGFIIGLTLEMNHYLLQINRQFLQVEISNVIDKWFYNTLLLRVGNPKLGKCFLRVLTNVAGYAVTCMISLLKCP